MERRDKIEKRERREMRENVKEGEWRGERM